jgi:hypothetical protein
VGVVAECGGGVESGMCVILVFSCLGSFNGFGLDFEPSCLILADVEMDVEAQDVHMLTDFYMRMTDRMALHRSSVLALPNGVGETGSIA